MKIYILYPKTEQNRTLTISCKHLHSWKYTHYTPKQNKTERWLYHVNTFTHENIHTLPQNRTKQNVDYNQLNTFTHENIYILCPKQNKTERWLYHVNIFTHENIHIIPQTRTKQSIDYNHVNTFTHENIHTMPKIEQNRTLTIIM